MGNSPSSRRRSARKKQRENPTLRAELWFCPSEVLQDIVEGKIDKHQALEQLGHRIFGAGEKEEAEDLDPVPTALQVVADVGGAELSPFIPMRDNCNLNQKPRSGLPYVALLYSKYGAKSCTLRFEIGATALPEWGGPDVTFGVLNEMKKIAMASVEQHNKRYNTKLDMKVDD